MENQRRIEWLDPESEDCLDKMTEVLRDELDVHVAMGMIVPQDSESTKAISGLLADVLLNAFVVSRRGLDRPRLRWIDEADATSR